MGSGSERALLVHGNDLCGEFYRPLAEKLALRGVTTTLVTLPGFHHEPPLAGPSWQDFARLVADALPGPEATLLGHSMGGLLALLVAARQPAALSRLVLLEPAIFPWRWLAQTAARRYLATVVAGDRERFVNWNGGMRRICDPARFPAAALSLYLEVRRTSDRATGEALFRTLPGLYPLPFARVRVPTLLVTGAASGWRARGLRRPLRARLRPAAHAVIPGAAHWLANERDDEVAACVAEFVSRPAEPVR